MFVRGRGAVPREIQPPLQLASGRQIYSSDGRVYSPAGRLWGLPLWAMPGRLFCSPRPSLLNAPLPAGPPSPGKGRIYSTCTPRALPPQFPPPPPVLLPLARPSRPALRVAAAGSQGPSRRRSARSARA
ncbi:hypothetical protein SCP_1602780 [Sparassis crispa]|uniref:Uncharacterized protein n=1 Tax=Sparassis crispa TaxID=139825 RepID=A0A401H5A5_9APHY|nr:hypothetical protein SCP_1602780 [Sparassis crispa]GBE89615.1 hypothetical protein SCP_1602780 [Sparassis crispa]